MKLAFNCFCFEQTDDLFGLLAEVSDSGFSGVGITTRQLSALRMAGLKGVNSAGLNGIGLYVLFLRLGGAGRIELLRRLDDCAAHKLESLVVIPTAAWGNDPDWANRLAELLEETQLIHPSVRIVLEPLHDSLSKVSCLTRLADLKTILALAGSSGLGWVLDVLHVNLEGCLSLTPKEVGAIHSVHLADRLDGASHDERLLPGQGVLPLDQICRFLEARGFSGWWEVELINSRSDLWVRRQIVQAAAAAVQELTEGLRI